MISEPLWKHFLTSFLACQTKANMDEKRLSWFALPYTQKKSISYLQRPDVRKGYFVVRRRQLTLGWVLIVLLQFFSFMFSWFRIKLNRREAVPEKIKFFHGKKRQKRLITGNLWSDNLVSTWLFRIYKQPNKLSWLLPSKHESTTNFIRIYKKALPIILAWMEKQFHFVIWIRDSYEIKLTIF